MKDIDLVITPRDPLLFRDGRPFGQAGVAQTGGLNWPRPGTIAGMLRTFVGYSRDRDYFAAGPQKENHINKIKKVGLGLFLPALKTHKGMEICLPAPTDAVAFLPKNMEHIEKRSLNIKALVPKDLNYGEGTDISWSNWLYPWIEEHEKPQQMPPFWRWNHYKEWLINNKLDLPVTGILPDDLGPGEPVIDERTHVCIDKESGTAVDSRIFNTSGCSFRHEMKIVAQVKMDDTDTPAGLDMALLGGDRRMVHIEWGQDIVTWPRLPEKIGEGVKGLRLVLATPGMFEGGWAPSWLLKSLEEDSWETVPGTEIRLRLRSACIPHFLPSHGWDMTKGKFGAPKPMRKMIKAGAVFFVQVHEDTDPKKAAEILWSTSLCEDKQDVSDGFGRILVGNWQQVTETTK
ncbi:MAG TPA: hypothetical protein ENF70_02535 [Deltaproteobacteria bacterium]|nr:hypothetical protein [Deltaproteobacteria bacterium]